jgi:acyl transferase domain-containing protein
LREWRTTPRSPPRSSSIVNERESTGCGPISRNTWYPDSIRSWAAHTAHARLFRGELLSALHAVRARAAAVPIVSTVTGRWQTEEERFDADYWWRNVSRPVLFQQAAQLLIESGYHVFLEIGPQPVLSRSLTMLLERAGERGVVLHSLNPPEGEQASMLRSLDVLRRARAA